MQIKIIMKYHLTLIRIDTILKKYRKELWNPFVGAVKKYELIQSGDKIAVCISGGKDSMLMAMLIKQLQKISEVPFEAEYMVMDPGYNPQNRAKIEENAKIKLDVFPEKTPKQYFTYLNEKYGDKS